MQSTESNAYCSRAGHPPDTPSSSLISNGFRKKHHQAPILNLQQSQTPKPTKKKSSFPQTESKCPSDVTTHPNALIAFRHSPLFCVFSSSPSHSLCLCCLFPSPHHHFLQKSRNVNIPKEIRDLAHYQHPLFPQPTITHYKMQPPKSVTTHKNHTEKLHKQEPKTKLTTTHKAFFYL